MKFLFFFKRLRLFLWPQFVLATDNFINTNQLSAVPIIPNLASYRLVDPQSHGESSCCCCHVPYYLLPRVARVPGPAPQGLSGYGKRSIGDFFPPTFSHMSFQVFILGRTQETSPGSLPMFGYYDECPLCGSNQ